MSLPEIPSGSLKVVEYVGSTSCQMFAQCTLSVAMRLERHESLMRSLSAVIGEAAHSCIDQWIAGEGDQSERAGQAIDRTLESMRMTYQEEGRADRFHFPLPVGNRRIQKTRAEAIRLLAAVRQRKLFASQVRRPAANFKVKGGSSDQLPAALPGTGSWVGSEVWVKDPALRICGQIDLLTLGPSQAEIVDHKTGFSVSAEDDNPTLIKYSHQLSLYGLVVRNRYRLANESIKLAIWTADGIREVRFDIATAEKSVGEIRGSLDDAQPRLGSHCQRCGKRHACAAYRSDTTRLGRAIPSDGNGWSFDVWGRLIKDPVIFDDGTWQMTLLDASGRERLVTHLAARHELQDIRAGDSLALFGLKPAGYVAPEMIPPAVLRGASGDRLDESTIYRVAGAV